MGKVIESTLVSLDGVIGDPMVWANEDFEEEAVATSLAQLRVSDAMMMAATPTSCSQRPGPRQRATTPTP